MYVEWEENKQASRSSHVLYVNGEKVCAIRLHKDLRTLADYWLYAQPGCDSVQMDAFDVDGAKAEAVEMVRKKLRQMLAALETP